MGITINKVLEIDDENIVYSSKIPESIIIGNLVFDKQYEEAIALGKNLLQKNPKDYGVHINLMEAYFKARNEDPSYFNLSTFHAKQAVIYGHNTGLAQQRLAINLEKELKIHQAIQLCDIILSDKFYLSLHGFGSKEDYTKRKIRLIKKLDKSIDTEYDRLFTDEEVRLIYDNLRRDITFNV